MTRTCSLKPGWNMPAIALMVFGFIVFWPLGLAMLAYILWGDRMKSAWNEARPGFERTVGDIARRGGFEQRPGPTGNAAFDDYRDRELKRLEEERAAIDRMGRDFDDFLRNLRKAKDQEEFDRFMASRGTAS